MLVNPAFATPGTANGTCSVIAGSTPGGIIATGTVNGTSSVQGFLPQGAGSVTGSASVQGYIQQAYAKIGQQIVEVLVSPITQTAGTANGTCSVSGAFGMSPATGTVNGTATVQAYASVKLPTAGTINGVVSLTAFSPAVPGSVSGKASVAGATNIITATRGTANGTCRVQSGMGTVYMVPVPGSGTMGSRALGVNVPFATMDNPPWL